MFEECYEPLPDRDAYLSRIGLPEAEKPSLPYLDRLIYAHQCAVPFEDLDIHDMHRDISLATDDLFDKIVTRRRGGYCFELNALFCALLRTLGFDVSPGMARVTMVPTPHAACTHRISIVSFDEDRYLVDVGFGGPMPACALKLEDGFSRTDHGQTFSIGYRGDGWWDLLYEGAEGTTNPLRFSAAAAEECDYVALSYFHSQHPDSHFVNTRLVNIRTPQGNRGITGNVYSERTPENSLDTEIASAEQLDEILEESFGIADWR